MNRIIQAVWWHVLPLRGVLIPVRCIIENFERTQSSRVIRVPEIYRVFPVCDLISPYEPLRFSNTENRLYFDLYIRFRFVWNSLIKNNGTKMVRKLKYHEKKLLKKVDFISWTIDNNLHEGKILRRYHIKNRQHYSLYNTLAAEVSFFHHLSLSSGEKTINLSIKLSFYCISLCF